MGVKSAASTAVEKPREEKQLFAFGMAEARGLLSSFSASQFHQAQPQTSVSRFTLFLFCEMGITVTPRPRKPVASTLQVSGALVST